MILLQYLYLNCIISWVCIQIWSCSCQPAMMSWNSRRLRRSPSPRASWMRCGGRWQVSWSPSTTQHAMRSRRMWKAGNSLGVGGHEHDMCQSHPKPTNMKTPAFTCKIIPSGYKMGLVMVRVWHSESLRWLRCNYGSGTYPFQELEFSAFCFKHSLFFCFWFFGIQIIDPREHHHVWYQTTIWLLLSEIPLGISIYCNCLYGKVMEDRLPSEFPKQKYPTVQWKLDETDTLLGTNSSVLNIGLHGPQKKGSSPIPPFFKGKLFVLGMENSSSSCFSLTTLFKHTRHQTPLRRKDWLNERAKNPKEFNKIFFFLMCKCHVSGLKKFFRSQKDMPGKTKASVDSFMDPEEMDVRWWIQYSVFQYF